MIGDMAGESKTSKRRFELVQSDQGRLELVAEGDKSSEEEQISEINDDLSEFIDHYTRELEAERKGFTPIHVDEIASKLAGLYEKIRKVVDWKDDNALRRGAIERILKRLLFPKLTGMTINEIAPDDLAETVTMELIRGGHLPNDRVPRERAENAGLYVKKYLSFLHDPTLNTMDVKSRVNFTTFVIEIAACEIEEILTHPMKEYGLIKVMTEMLDKRLKIVPETAINQEEKTKQLFVAVCRTLYDLDDNFIIYRMLRNKYHYWRHPNEEQTKVLGQNLYRDWNELKQEINLPISQKFTSLAERMDTAFVLIDDVLEQRRGEPKKIREAFEYKTDFTGMIDQAYEKRHKTLKTRLFRLGAFSTLSVFLSNWVTFYIVEVPLAKLFYEGFSLAAAVVDFAIPTAVMFLLVSIIRPPGQNNKAKVIKTTLSFVYPDEGGEGFRIRMTERPSIFRWILGIMYTLTIILVFLAVAWVFYVAHLPMTSVIFDTFTIAMTVFAAHTIKNKSRELNVDEQISVFDFLLDIITLPIAKVGSFFAAKWKEYNIISILFNFVIEMPFSIILNFIQEWSEFLKERRAELH